jgi:CubicO group peptidase (beta-lactamase class C family)
MLRIPLVLLAGLGLAGPVGSVDDAETTSSEHSASAECQAIGLVACPPPFDDVLPAAQSMLTWDRQSRVIGFRNTYRLYAGDAFHTLGGRAYPLPPAPDAMSTVRYEFDRRTYSLDDYLHRQSVTGLLILKNGRVAYEYYGSGNTDKTLWTSRSIAKSIVSTLIGVAIKEGFIHSVADPITHCLPELKGSAWDGVTLRDLLQHSSGVAWNENYADANSDFARLTQCEASPSP